MKVADVIKYEGDNTTFIWKHPCEDFNSMTQLIVHESQEAVFFMNGEALDLFGPGRHTLETQNLPLLGRKINRVTGGDSPFHCEVYFINKTEQMAIKWGTDSKVQYMEPTYGFPVSIGASGEMCLQVADSRKLLLKVVGTENALGQAKLTGMFRSFLMTKVKSYLGKVIKDGKINIFEIDEHLVEISDSLLDMLKADYADYGVSLERFFVTTVLKPDGDPSYEKFKSLYFRQYADVAEAELRQRVEVIDAETEARRTIIESRAMATKRAQEGYTYQQERGFDVATAVARNEASGQMANLGVGLGMMAGVGGTMAGVVGDSMKGAVDSAQSPAAAITCTKCGATLPENAKFCLACGERVVTAEQNTVVCPSCGKTVMKGKFCPECGHKFLTHCPVCGVELPEGAKFCLACGEKLI